MVGKEFPVLDAEINTKYTNTGEAQMLDLIFEQLCRGWTKHSGFLPYSDFVMSSRHCLRTRSLFCGRVSSIFRIRAFSRSAAVFSMMFPGAFSPLLSPYRIQFRSNPMHHTSAAGGDSGNALGQIRWIDEKREPAASDSLKYAP